MEGDDWRAQAHALLGAKNRRTFCDGDPLPLHKPGAEPLSVLESCYAPVYRLCLIFGDSRCADCRVLSRDLWLRQVQPPGCFFLATASLALFASLLTPHPHAASRVYSPAVSKESRL
jgi:hypothetical protein